MTDASLPAGRFTPADFRIGRVLSLGASLFRRNFLTYFVVTVVAGFPPLLVGILLPAAPAANPSQNSGAGSLTVFLTIVLNLLSQAIVLYGAFQDMRGRPVRLVDCLNVGLRRFFPIVGIAVCAGVAVLAYTLVWALAVAQLIKSLSPGFVALLSLSLVIPLLILYLMWFVAAPACVVERLGPIRSMRRSQALTKGHRWKIVGLILAVLMPVLIISVIIGAVMASMGIAGIVRVGIFLDSGARTLTLATALNLIWTAIWSAFFAIVGVVAYHDLRVAKEGVDTDQIAAVFE